MTSQLPSRTVVMIAEDDVDLSRMTRDMVEECGLSAFECASGQGAFDRLARDPGSVLALFADIGLSDSIDGLSLALVAAERYPAVSICVTSGQTDARPQVLPPKVRFISKPWRAAEVLAFIEGARAASGQAR